MKDSNVHGQNSDTELSAFSAALDTAGLFNKSHPVKSDKQGDKL
jgi:hypothetical protein